MSCSGIVGRSWASARSPVPCWRSAAPLTPIAGDFGSRLGMADRRRTGCRAAYPPVKDAAGGATEIPWRRRRRAAAERTPFVMACRSALRLGRLNRAVERRMPAARRRGNGARATFDMPGLAGATPCPIAAVSPASSSTATPGDLDAAARFWSAALGATITDPDSGGTGPYADLGDRPRALHVEVRKVDHPRSWISTSRRRTSVPKRRGWRGAARRRSRSRSAGGWWTRGPGSGSAWEDARASRASRTQRMAVGDAQPVGLSQ